MFRIGRIPLADLALFAVAGGLLAMASAAIRLLPFRWLVKTMEWGRRASERPDAANADRSMLALRRAADRLPWGTACFEQGLAAHWLLRGQGVPSVLHYGIDPGGEELSAHVWVSVEGRILIGEQESDRHALVASFPATAGGQSSGG